MERKNFYAEYKRIALESEYPIEFRVDSIDSESEVVRVIIGEISGSIDVNRDRYFVLGHPEEGKVVKFTNYQRRFGKKTVGLTDKVTQDVTDEIKRVLSK